MIRNYISFNYGFEGDYFAANFSTCTISMINWYFFELNTYKIKMRYADYNDAVTNTTLFLQNITSRMITCTSAIENLYYYGLREKERFQGGSDWALGLLQSLLGSVLRITAITNDLVEMGKQNITDIPKTLYYCGEILNMLLVFDPVSDDLTKTTSSDDRDLRSGHPKVGLPLELEHFDSTRAL